MADNPQKKDQTESDERLTQIVSYLDGELDDTQMNEIEHELINDPNMRSHADILSKTWALLDSLEDVSASRQFTQDTLATVSAETVENPDGNNAGIWLRRIRQGLARYHVLPCFLLGLLGGAIGLFVSDRAWQRRETSDELSTARVVLDNYELVKNADMYSIVPDSKQLRSLQLPEDPDASSSGDGQ